MRRILRALTRDVRRLRTRLTRWRASPDRPAQRREPPQPAGDAPQVARSSTDAGTMRALHDPPWPGPIERSGWG